VTDFRLEFQGQITNKALGWVVRARDPKNFYVVKLEIVKPGPSPSIALVHFAVTNGVEQPRKQVPLTMPVQVDTLYRVRLDALGNRLTTWVQDQKVDEWNGENLNAGGIGTYNERGERGTIQGEMKVFPIAVK
jgi:hypothetical protein